MAESTLLGYISQLSLWVLQWMAQELSICIKINFIVTFKKPFNKGVEVPLLVEMGPHLASALNVQYL